MVEAGNGDDRIGEVNVAQANTRILMKMVARILKNLTAPFKVFSFLPCP